MKIKKIISNVAKILGLDDVVELVENRASIKTIQENVNYSLLLRCTSLIVANISANFVQNVTMQSFDATDGVINLSEFSQPVQSIKQVVVNGRVVDHWLYHDKLVVPKGYVIVYFTFVPKIETGEEKVLKSLPNQVLEYGILAEYAFVSGMFNEGKVWNEKFLEMMFGIKNRTGVAVKMPISF